MKNFAILALCVVFVAVVSAYPADEKYEEIIPEVDIDEILSNERLRKNYFKCFKTGEGCTGQAKKIRDTIPDALTTGCAKCTDLQKQIGEKVLRHTLKNHPQDFKDLELQFDKEQVYRTKYADRLKEEGIVLPD